MYGKQLDMDGVREMFSLRNDMKEGYVRACVHIGAAARRVQ